MERTQPREERAASNSHKTARKQLIERTGNGLIPAVLPSLRSSEPHENRQRGTRGQEKRPTVTCSEMALPDWKTVQQCIKHPVFFNSIVVCRHVIRRTCGVMWCDAGAFSIQRSVIQAVPVCTCY